MENINNKYIEASLARHKGELEQILSLQEKNLAISISEKDMKVEGFVTLKHDLTTLEQMNQLAPSVIIKSKDEVVGYALTMLRGCRHLVADLEPMFAILDQLTWNDRILNALSYYVMGQICIDKAYRGLGLFEKLYSFHKKINSSTFELLVTEIATRNARSIKAHERLGFKTIHIHRDELDEWAVVAWDWS